MEGSCSKRRRVADPAHANGGDLLSAVPDDVILHVMSFLTTRQAVRTSLVSRRWRNLWRSVPCINVNINEFLPSGTELTDDDLEREFAFKMFMEKVVELRDPTALIRTFLFRCCRLDGFEGIADMEDINGWISHALQKQPRVMDIAVMYDALHLDHSVFTCSYLTRIKLTNIILMDGFFKQLETGCPVLENLFLFGGVVVDTEISSRTLKDLTIIETDFHNKRISFSTPSVTNLEFWRQDICVTNLPLLVTSLLVLKDIQNSSDFCRTLKSLSAAKVLKFDYFGRKLRINNNLQWYPKFNNLVRLTLGQWCLDANFYGLIVFLQNSPKLEELTLELEKETTQRIIGELEERSFTCEHLRSVEIVCWEDDPQVKDVVEFFVDSGLTSDQVRKVHWY
uniref:F-box domain-containing protein n=1 Tax=Leersia perrieri TaxID=77586 RepID=A0A0D9XHI9_9ORYZ